MLFNYTQRYYKESHDACNKRLENKQKYPIN